MNIFLAEITSYNPSTSSVVTWRFSSGLGFDNAGTFYKPRIENPATISRAMSGMTGGRETSNIGELTLVNIDGELDSMADHFFDGRTVTLKYGSDSGSYASFSTVLVATIDSISLEVQRISIRLRNRAVALDVPFSTTKYAGSNVLPAGIEGTADDIKGQYKPRVLGRIAHMAAVQVNTSKLIFQVNDGGVDAIVNVFDAGAYLTQGTDYTSQSDMETNAPTSGYWRAWPAGGCFRLGSSPYGQVTAAVAEKWDYAQISASALIQRVLTQIGFTSADWVAADLTTLGQKNSSGIGLLITNGDTIASIIDKICMSVGAWWGFDASGRFRVARFDAPSGSPVLTLTDTNIIQIERQPDPQPPVYSVTVKADINYAVIDAKSLAGVVPENRVAWLTQASRDQKAENTAVKTSRLLATEVVNDSYLNGIDTALAEANRRLSLYSARRDVITATLADPLSVLTSLDLGSIVSVQTPKFGYDAGRLMTVTGIRVDYQSSLVDLTLWG